MTQFIHTTIYLNKNARWPAEHLELASEVDSTLYEFRKSGAQIAYNVFVVSLLLIASLACIACAAAAAAVCFSTILILPLRYGLARCAELASSARTYASDCAVDSVGDGSAPNSGEAEGDEEEGSTP